MECPLISTLSDSTFPNTCLITGVTSNIPILSALSTCCGDANVHRTSDYCYTYCNITVASDVESWASCIGDNLDASDLQGVDLGCVADFPDDGEATATPAIATTWPALQVIETLLSSGSVVSATTVGGTATTTQASIVTSTSVSSGQSSSSTASPTSVKTQSGSVVERRASGLAIAVGVLICLSVLI